MFYPLKFKPIYKDYIWGGRNLQKLGKKLPPGIVAESWEVSCHKDGMSIVENGFLKDKTLKSLVDEYKDKITGDVFKESGNRFPLLIKFIDANDKLSVQVHPDDSYALAHENDFGKNEMWYIIDAKEGASLIYDVKPGVTKESFIKAFAENKLEDCLNTIPVSPGDYVNIPAGVVHAVGEGILLAEVQQNSNTTYRLYDYNRRDKNGNLRPLHIEKALDVIDFNAESRKVRKKGLVYELGNESFARILVANSYFCTELFSVSGCIDQDTGGRQFHIFACISGEGSLYWNGERMPFRKGETVLIPSALGKYFVDGDMKALKAYVPDINRDIFDRLQDMGFSADEITGSISGL